MKHSSTQLELSAGGVIYRRGSGDEVEVVLVATEHGQRWGLPKGWIENGELAEEAAVREVAEETGLICRVVDRLERIEYWFRRKGQEPPVRVHKFVYFFLMEVTGGDLRDHDWEVDEGRWFPLGEALGRVSYRSERQILEKVANRFRALADPGD